jgi:hypothetical protein
VRSRLDLKSRNECTHCSLVPLALLDAVAKGAGKGACIEKAEVVLRIDVASAIGEALVIAVSLGGVTLDGMSAPLCALE